MSKSPKAPGIHVATLKISVIVPIYNVEKYLPECLDSILGQTYQNLEIILVDDKSSDGSGKIADNYAKKDGRIKVVHRLSNGGLAAARNTGVKKATGDYLIFVDSDDILLDDAAWNIFDKVNRFGCDVVYYEFDLFENKPKFGIIMQPSDHFLLENDSFNLRHMPGRGRFMSFPASACKLAIKNSLIAKNNFSFDEKLKRCEDYPFFYAVLLKAEKISYIDKALYFYRQNRHGSITNDSKDVEYFPIALEQIRQFLIGEKLYDEFKIDFIKMIEHYLYHHTLHYEMNKKYFEHARKLLIEIGAIPYLENQAETDPSVLRLLGSFVSDNYQKFILAVDRQKMLNYDKLKFTGKKRLLCPTVFGTLNGGGERSSYQLWRWLNKHYDIIIALPKNVNDDYLDTCRRDGLNYIFCDYEHAKEKANIWVDFVKVIHDLDIDGVFPALYFESAFKAAAVTNLPAVFLDYGQLQQLTTIRKDDSEYKKYFADELRMSNLILTNALSGVAAALDFADRRAIYSPSYTEKPTAKFKKIPTTRLICPARIEPEKNQFALVQAAAKLRSTGLKNQIILIGNHEEKFPGHETYYQNIVDYIGKNNLQSSVKMPGWMDNPWDEFGENDIYATATQHEAMGRATLEAVELGIPILIPDIPGHREFREIIGIADEHFYQPGDMDDFVKKAEFLIANIAGMKKQAKIYARRALDEFSEEKCNKNILPALEKIIGQGNPGMNTFIGQMKFTYLDYDYRMELIEQYRTELASFLSTKRSLKRLIGNSFRLAKKVFPKPLKKALAPMYRKIRRRG